MVYRRKTQWIYHILKKTRTPGSDIFRVLSGVLVFGSLI